jgi:hypothetical protein
VTKRKRSGHRSHPPFITVNDHKVSSNRVLCITDNNGLGHDLVDIGRVSTAGLILLSYDNNSYK